MFLLEEFGLNYGPSNVDIQNSALANSFHHYSNIHFVSNWYLVINVFWANDVH
jgi:hypothetical protein